MDFVRYDVERDGGAAWLVSPDGQRVCDLRDMRLLDFGGWISVEGGLVFEQLDAALWRERLISLGLELN